MESLQAPGVGIAFVLGLILVLGNFTAILSIRLAVLGRIAPDTMAGIRTNATRATPDSWDAAHRAAWPWALVLNGLAAIGGVAVMATGSTVTPFLTAAGFAVIFTIAGALAQIIVGHRAATRVLNRK
ncbi:SdpI family protein [Gulosibacter chungangensis]|uniref:SdpI family protein n=1 Tax=Gulosibacter chungangensis TaxID=979746 RepID=A0A7J5B9E7_9MICO|nr:SdpI family protein [Gulosibacter chungangensis]KAB1642208.1 SdpI family protein [Gulosibacter chungangensis]